MISGTIEPMGTTLAGQTIEAFFISRTYETIICWVKLCDWSGFMRTIFVHYLIYRSVTFLVIQMQVFLMKMDITMNLHLLLLKKVKRFAEEGWVNIIGGCCGTTPEHIKAMKSALASLKPRDHHERDMELVD